jgi:hypothetical protein
VVNSVDRAFGFSGAGRRFDVISWGDSISETTTIGMDMGSFAPANRKSLTVNHISMAGSGLLQRP